MALPSFMREQVPLADFTTFRIGGPALWFAEPATREELALALDFAGRMGVPVLVLGGGSNLLVDDAGVEAMVVRLAPGGDFSRIRHDGDDPLAWRVGAAAALPALVGEAARAGAAGLESLAGIPGTVGGAARMNAGGRDHGIGKCVAGAEVWDFGGNAGAVGAAELGFVYRGSNLAGRIAVELSLRFEGRDEPEALLAKMRECRAAKARSQPVDMPSAGCVFKNPAGDAAGRLLDAAGCKGLGRGGAEVSARHANFIVNRGGATSRDVLDLVEAMRAAVREKFDIGLEPEILIWGGKAPNPASHE